ncbi:MAG: phosphonate ABC transporter ATP-binding protein [Planctomycetota bacterium]|nr:MAG: phosphonate ABC transporter ATP-binding protein [Planctomycetota bacterium]
MSIISAQGIQVRYPGSEHAAVDGVDLHLSPGQRTVLLGPSGAGKSSLLRVLAQLQEPQQGTIYSDDPQLRTANSRQWRCQVSMVFQDHALIPRKSALWHVLLGRLGRRSIWGSCWWWPRADITAAFAALERVGLSTLAHRPVRQLSGGQRQRVGIARALLQHPRVLLADEPIASLDPQTGRDILQLLGTLLSDDPQRALLVSLHQVEAAQSWADRIIGLRQGRICFDGPPAALHHNDLHQIYGNDHPQQSDHSLAAPPPVFAPTRHHLIPME